MLRHQCCCAFYSCYWGELGLCHASVLPPIRRGHAGHVTRASRTNSLSSRSLKSPAINAGEQSPVSLAEAWSLRRHSARPPVVRPLRRPAAGYAALLPYTTHGDEVVEPLRYYNRRRQEEHDVRDTTLRVTFFCCASVLLPARYKRVDLTSLCSRSGSLYGATFLLEPTAYLLNTWRRVTEPGSTGDARKSTTYT
ncbi:uncharacterized protein LOC125759229 [Rhipicephalus sanguineus]|uniref:uncharacterized protein LOC125759229 n=1 Tax=Rhipicephalus sanguineus TaxID=34632 RepID=UPI0020C598C3|nr:uncharacterized protein LOC125759229 [Rhipicephalus sanguineus]